MAARIVSPEFVGRDPELAALALALDDARQGRARVMLIGGEAGIGKTRLLAEWLEHVRPPALVLSGGCIPVAEGSLPFAALADAIRSLVHDGGLAESSTILSRVVPEVARLKRGSPPSPSSDLETMRARGQLYEAWLELLTDLSRSRPVVLAIEDVHWADASTLDLLSFLVRAARRLRLALACTFRSDEVERRHPLLRWLGDIERQPHVERIELGPLTREEVGRQVAAILRRPAGRGVVDRVYARAEGNPFFVEELVAAGVETDLLPPTLRDILAARLGHVSDATLRILGVAAIVGRRVDHELLASICRLDEPALDDAVRRAIVAGLLVDESGDGAPRYAFRHALIAEVAAATVPPARRLRLHAAIAEALARSPSRRGDEAVRLGEIAHHWVKAGNAARAVPASVEAAQAAMSRAGYSEACGHFQQALDNWDRLDEPQRLDLDRVELMRLAAQSAFLAGDFDAAIGLLRDAIDRTHERGESIREGLLYERLGRALYWSGAFVAGLGAYERALELVPEHPPNLDRARVAAGYAQALVLAARLTEGLEVATQALDVARAAGSRQLEGHLLTTIGTALSETPDFERGIELMREGLEIAQEVGDVDDILRAYANLTACLAMNGRYAETIELGLEGVEAARRLHATPTEGAYVIGNTANALVMLGRWDEALGLLRRGTAGAVGAFRLGIQRDLACIAALRGEYDEASTALDELESHFAHETEPQWLAPVAAYRIELSLATADVDLGRMAADRAEPTLASPEVFFSAMVLVPAMKLEALAAERARAAHDEASLVTCLRRANRQLEALRGLAAPAGPGVGGYVRCAVALGEAEMSRVRDEPSAALWRDVLSLADSSIGVYDVAYVRFRLAEALLATSSARAAREEANGVLAQAYEAAVMLGARPLARQIESLAARSRLRLVTRAAERRGQPTAASEAADATRATEALVARGLTSREIEVLRLLATGCTNRQIAEALFITESTAGVHVSHILAKLDMHRRVEAATMAARLGIAR